MSIILYVNTLVAHPNIPPSESTINNATKEIIETGHFLHNAKLCPATSGNISVRLGQDLIAITASGKHKGALTQDDILLMTLDGTVHSNKKPSAETLLHTTLYAFNTGIGAVIHTHTLNGTLLSRIVAPQTLLTTNGYELHKVFPGITTHESEVIIPIFENSQDIATLSQEVVRYLQTHSNVFGYLIRNHGFYTWGRDMNEARMRVEAFEYLFESEMKLRTFTK